MCYKPELFNRISEAVYFPQPLEKARTRTIGCRNPIIPVLLQYDAL